LDGTADPSRVNDFVAALNCKQGTDEELLDGDWSDVVCRKEMKSEYFHDQ
jgi:hypothetical protein